MTEEHINRIKLHISKYIENNYSLLVNAERQRSTNNIYLNKY